MMAVDGKMFAPYSGPPPPRAKLFEASRSQAKQLKLEDQHAKRGKGPMAKQPFLKAATRSTITPLQWAFAFLLHVLGLVILLAAYSHLVPSPTTIHINIAPVAYRKAHTEPWSFHADEVTPQSRRLESLPPLQWNGPNVARQALKSFAS